MYYVTTHTDNYSITTSYATKQQAERYGGEIAHSDELHLLRGSDSEVIGSILINTEKEFQDLGRVRTIMTRDSYEVPGRYMIYYCDLDEDDKTTYTYTGISYDEYGPANTFLKSKSLRLSFGDLVIVENPNASQAFDARGTTFSIDVVNGKINEDT